MRPDLYIHVMTHYFPALRSSDLTTAHGGGRCVVRSQTAPLDDGTFGARQRARMPVPRTVRFRTRRGRRRGDRGRQVRGSHAAADMTCTSGLLSPDATPASEKSEIGRAHV